MLIELAGLLGIDLAAKNIMRVPMHTAKSVVPATENNIVPAVENETRKLYGFDIKALNTS